jgi:Cys-tRNA(Pro) deacylase
MTKTANTPVRRAQKTAQKDLWGPAACVARSQGPDVAKDNLPVTAAIRMLREHRVSFVAHVYDYEPRGGTAHSARCLGVSEHCVIKTLVMQDDAGQPLVVLMHGDREVSTKALARYLGAKSVQPCVPAVADRHSGYQVGGTSPFGLRRAMPVYMQASIAGLPRIYINGGRRGMLVEIDPADLVRVLQPAVLDVATSAREA